MQIKTFEVDPTDPRELTIEYVARNERGRLVQHWLVCGFRGNMFRGERLTLVKVVTDRRGVFNATQLQMLRIWQRLMAPQHQRLSGEVETGPPGAPIHSPLYLLQQLVNSIVPCSVYALLAAGFTLVYGLIGRINFAFGDIATVAGLTLYLGLTIAAGTGAGDAPWVWAAATAVAVGIAAVWGFASERYVFRPLARSSGQAALIAAIGLAMAMREGLRLAQGSRDFWLAPIVTRSWVLARDGETAVSTSGQQLVVLAAATACCAAVVLLLRFSRFGLCYRACRDDRRMAALVGVDARRIAALTFAVGGAASGVAGLFVTAYYGTVNAYVGLALGFKALVAAIAGGLGSVAGAIAGGLAVGLIEQLWSAYLTFGYRDLAIFGLLAAVLIFRPRGLFGRAEDAGDRPRP